MKSAKRIQFYCSLLFGSLITALHVQAQSVPDFSKEIYPLFEKNCIKCHGPEKQKGALRLDINESLFETAESGEKPVVPGHASESRLIKLVSSKDDAERMPPKGAPLAGSDINLLKRWIDGGAKVPASTNSTGLSRKPEMIVTEEDRKHWSYLPLRQPAPPGGTALDAAQTDIDRFILAKLDQNGLTMSPEANPRKIARQIYFDLIGLPPTPEQIEAFVKEHQADSRRAVSSLVDSLLASPRYGERWARHWLDVVRYADSDGQESDADRPTAYHYRDFVIRSLNEDSPFDQFVRWQLAGDEIEPNNPDAIAATGFIVAGTHAELSDNLMEEERIRTRFNELDDMLATTGSAMLGLTLACARCHDHKYDPIPRRDYYRMLCAFNGGDRAEVPLAPLEEVRRYRASQKQWKSDHDHAKNKWDEFFKEIKKKYEEPARQTKIDALKIGDAEKALLKSKTGGDQARELSKKYSKELKLETKDYRPFLTESEVSEWVEREKSVKDADAEMPAPLPTALAFADFGPKPRETFLLARGDFRNKSELLELGVLTALTRGKTPAEYWSSAKADIRRPESTQQRRALAEWMTDLDHGPGALVARVMVNRIWQHHFGQGLVRTVNDFGTRCEPPSHPELLEWLASEFVKSGWKLKPLHRLIMTSSAYLQDTRFDAAKSKIDPEDRLLWRRRPQRVEAEILRDSMLAVSGTLNLEMYGPAIKAPIAPEAIQARNMKDPYPGDIKDSAGTHRRSVYIFHKRVVQQPLMQAFDGPDAQASCGRRDTTTVAPQALALLNDKFVRARALNFAERVRHDAAAGLPDQLQLAWRLALAREPSAAELSSAQEFFERQLGKRLRRDSQIAKSESETLVLADICQTLFALNEFIYVD